MASPPLDALESAGWRGLVDSLLEAAPDRVALFDQRTRVVLAANKQICVWLGQAASEIVGSSIDDHLAIQPSPPHAGREAAFAGDPVRVSRRDSVGHGFVDGIIDILGAAGGVGRLQLTGPDGANCADLADRIQGTALRARAEQLSPGSEEARVPFRYEALFQLAPDAIFLIEAEGPEKGRIVEANEMAARMHGYGIHEIIGMNIRDLDAPNDAQRVDSRLRDMRDGKRHEFDVTHLCKDGSELPMRVTASQVSIDGRNYLLAFNKDVTDERRALQELMVSEERLNLATAAGGVGAWDWDLVTGRVVFSEEWKRHLGHSGVEIADSPGEFFSRIHPSDRESVERAIEDYLEGRTDSYRVELRLRRRDGGYHWIESRGRKHLDERGRPVRMIGCHLDITERKASARRRRESRDRWRAAFTEAPVASLVVALDARRSGRIVLANRAAGELYGCDWRTLKGKPLWEFCANDRCSSIFERLRDVRVGEHVVHELDHYRADGSVFPVEATFTKALLRGVEYAFVVVTDIADRRRYEAANQYQTDILRAQAEAFPGGIIVFADDGRCVLKNDRFVRMWRLESPLSESCERDPIQRHIRSLLAPSHDPEGAEPVLCPAEGDDPQELLRLHDGRVIERYEAPARDASGATFGTICFFSDVTRRVRSEELLRDRDRELALAARTGVLGEALSEIAHEINQPLYAISNLATATRIELDRAISNADVCGRLEKIEALANGGSKIIERIRGFIGGGEAKQTKLDVTQLVFDAMELMKLDAEREQVRLIYDGPPSGVRTVGDAVGLQQVLVNLIKNAVEAVSENASSEQRVVRLVSQVRGDEAVLGVVDQGPGVSEEMRDQVFERFVTSKHAGMGMGLAIARTIVEQHGGRIWFEDTHGDRPGAAFHFSLPLRDGAAPAHGRGSGGAPGFEHGAGV